MDKEHSETELQRQKDAEASAQRRAAENNAIRAAGHQRKLQAQDAQFNNGDIVDGVEEIIATLHEKLRSDKLDPKERNSLQSLLRSMQNTLDGRGQFER